MVAARGASASSDLSQYDEQLLFSRFSSQFTPADHDKRIDALLFGKKTTDAYRMLPWSSAGRRAALSARIALLSLSADAEQRYQAVILEPWKLVHNQGFIYWSQRRYERR